MEVLRSIQTCIKSIKKHNEKGSLKDPMLRLYFAAGYLQDIPEVEELLNVIIGKENSPASDQTKRD